MPRAFDLKLERRWRERSQAFERSGLSVREFCRAEAIREHTFFYWRRELAKRDRLRQSGPSIPVQHRLKPRANRRRRRMNGKSSSHAKPPHRTSAFVPVQLISEPLGSECMEFRFGTCLVRMPTSIDERALRQVIRVLREEAAGC